MSYEERAVAHFERVLAAVGERAAEIDPRPVASMWPHVGSAYRRGGVFVLGQALDGWDPDECSARVGPYAYADLIAETVMAMRPP